MLGLAMHCGRAAEILGFLATEQRPMVSGVNSGRGFPTRDSSYAVVLSSSACAQWHLGTSWQKAVRWQDHIELLQV